ncbi:YaiI/YqxD family protein [Salsuginibacillus kocurii]|uniref:YaiI/YqxD family protein n=1 Tax=Salsuginibacillus kocurii TaxID=427078 RepID=UPI00047644D1|nr:YaiI/YqxD family protein [Salsuginibacillus kocurii]
MKLYVDADASPAKDTIITIAAEAELPVVLVKSFAHFSHADEPEGVETVYVDSGSEAADYKIMQLAKKNDIIITQDYGLASLGLAKGCQVLHHKGFAYTNENIDRLLDTRHLSAMARKSGQRTKGPKAYTEEERAKFEQLLRQVIPQQTQE